MGWGKRGGGGASEPCPALLPLSRRPGLCAPSTRPPPRRPSPSSPPQASSSASSTPSLTSLPPPPNTHTPHPPPHTHAGIVVCILTTLIATDLKPARVVAEIESTLKMQLIVSTILMTPVG